MINSTIWNNTVIDNIDILEKGFDEVTVGISATVWDTNTQEFMEHNLTVIVEGYDTIRIFADSYGVEGSDFTNVDHSMILKLDLEDSDTITLSNKIPTPSGDVEDAATNGAVEIAYAIMDKAQEGVFEILIEVKFEDEVSQFEDYWLGDWNEEV